MPWPLAFSETMVGTFRRPVPGGRDLPNILLGMVTTLYLAAAPGAGGPGGDNSASIGPTVLLVGTIVGLLALFALAAVLLAGFHRRRLETDNERPPDPHTDAWREAGRRLEVPDEGDSG
jgi:hypothetical protein